MSNEQQHGLRADDEAVKLFEQQVLTQATPLGPWVPVSDYSLTYREQIEGPHPELIARLFPNSRVLDVGCGPEAALVQLLRRQHMQAYGIDSGPLRVPPHIAIPGSILHSGQLDKVDKVLGQFDLLICREVLEHLTVRQIAIAIRNLCRLTTKWIYITTRYARMPQHLLSLDQADELDPTHISMLTKPFIRMLCILEGCYSRRDLEMRLDWQGQGRCLIMQKAGGK